jgi:hypothetical protein
MTEFDISRYIFGSDIEGDGCDKHGTFDQLLRWVYKNIGKQTQKNSLTSPIMRCGHGWEIQTRKSVAANNNESFGIISWHMCIEDEQKAMMFALKW